MLSHPAGSRDEWRSPDQSSCLQISLPLPRRQESHCHLEAGQQSSIFFVQQPLGTKGPYLHFQDFFFWRLQGIKLLWERNFSIQDVSIVRRRLWVLFSSSPDLVSLSGHLKGFCFCSFRWTVADIGVLFVHYLSSSGANWVRHFYAHIIL